MFANLVRAGIALLTLLLVTGATLAEDITFTGEVSYRERIALPPDAELWITLVSISDARPVVSAAADVAPRGQVPLQFTLNVRSQVIADGRDYGLIAEIRSQGRTMFRNWQPVPVDPIAPVPTGILVTLSPDPPHDPPEPILPPEEAPNPLLDTIWRVTSIGGDPVLGATELTLSIAADLRSGGHGGCNNYFTEADFIESPLSFGPIAGTRMACAPDVMGQEARFFAALNAIAGYELSGDALKLFDAAGIPLVGLVRGP